MGNIKVKKIELERQVGNMDNLEELYRKIENITANEDPLMVAGIMMAQALKIYKIILSEEEFKMLTDHIGVSAEQIDVDGPGPVIH